MLRIAAISDSGEFLDLVKPLLTERGYEVYLYPLSDSKLTESLVNTGVEVAVMDFFADHKLSKKVLETIRSSVEDTFLHVISVFDKAPTDGFDFKVGIDDFIFKDSLEREIALKVELYQWKYHKIDSSDMIVVNEFVIDNANFEASFKGKQLTLTFKEFELLKFLITHRGRVYSRDALLNQVWGYNYYGGTRTVDVHVRRLRSKIGIDIDKYLKTVRNVGYKFEA